MFRRNTAGQSIGFALVSASTGAALTGSAVTVYRSIDGGPQAAAQGTVSEKGNGQYVFSPTAADLDGGQVSFLFVATGAVLEEKTIVTTAANPQDGAGLGLTRLDAAVSSRSTYAGSDTSGTTTLLSRVSAAVALAGSAPSWYAAPPTVEAIADGVWDELKVDHAVVGSFGAIVDVAISSRSTFSGGAVASVTAPVSLTLSQTLTAPRALDAIADAALTLNDALHCAIAGAAGKESKVGTTYTVMTPSTGTILRAFALDDADNPTTRT